MNNSPAIRLMTLLHLVSDQYDPGEQRRIEAIVREDSDALARLQHLRGAVGRARSLRFESRGGDSSYDEDATQRIAAFFDGMLNAEETIAFERECWESIELLQEVIVLFQSALQTEPGCADESNVVGPTAEERPLRKRLVGLFPEEGSVAPRINGATTALRAATRHPRPPLDSDNESVVDSRIDVVPRSSSKKPNKKTRHSNAIIMVAGMAVALALIATSIVVMNWSSIDGPPSVVVESPEVPGLQNKVDPNPEVVGPGDARPFDGDPDSPPRDRIVDLPNPNNQLRNHDRETTDLKGPGEREVLSPGDLVESVIPKKDSPTEPVDKAAVEPEISRIRLAWSWDRVEGLVAVRTSDSDVWSGALAQNELRPEAEEDIEQVVGLECKVLPLSWAQANLEEWGSWTFTENTEFSVTSTPIRYLESQSSESQSSSGAQTNRRPENSIDVRINLRSGRLAIANAKVGSVVLIETSPRNWNIRITAPNSVVIVEQDSNSRVMVQKGSANVNGTELKARQQLVRGRDNRLQQTVNRETVRWLRKPENKFPSKQLADQWLSSRDLFADLSRPNVISPKDQPFVRAAFATIDPPGRAAMYLANVIPEVQSEGIQWLIGYGHDQRRLRKLSDELATELATPGLRTTLPRLVMAIQRKRWPPKTDAEMLITGLQSRNASVRRLSHGFLIHLFGALEFYNSESDAATRNLQARKWLAAINRLYRRVENARQR